VNSYPPIARHNRYIDQYDWLTALLGARQAQTLTCRLTAAIIAIGAVVPIVMIPNLADPYRLPKIVISVAITVCCAAMAALWLRSQWPSRLQSQLCVVTGSLCVAAACLIQTEAVFGLFGCTVFAVVGTFAAFFHSLRLLAFAWSVGVLTLGVLCARLIGIHASLAAGVVLVVVLVNTGAVFIGRMVIRLIDNDIDPGDRATLSGLLTRDAFYEGVATLIGARSRKEDRYLVVAVIELDHYSALIAMAGGATATQAQVAAGHKLRRTVRREALLAHAGEAEFWVADFFSKADPAVLIDRIRGAIADPPSRLTASIGSISTPLHPLMSHPPYAVLDEILAISTSAMHEARRAGGNQSRIVLDPALTVLDDDKDD
jgi:GGDEF domain-containing protein